MTATSGAPLGAADWDVGWRQWSDMARYYPSGVHRRRLIVRWVAPRRPGSLLDAGCGPGDLLSALRGPLPAARLTGVDQAAETIEANRRRLPWARFERLDLERERLPERFDAVVCSEVLEHIRDDRAALANLVEMTGRTLMLTVPTGPLLPLEAGFGHLRHYELGALCRLVEEHGLRVVRAQAWGFPFMTIFKRAANRRSEATLKAFGAGRWSWPKKAVGALLTAAFYLNLPVAGPQLLILAERPG